MANAQPGEEVVPSLRWGLGLRQRRDPRGGMVRVCGPEASRADVQEEQEIWIKQLEEGAGLEADLAVVCR